MLCVLCCAVLWSAESDCPQFPGYSFYRRQDLPGYDLLNYQPSVAGAVAASLAVARGANDAYQRCEGTANCGSFAVYRETSGTVQVRGAGRAHGEGSTAPCLLACLRSTCFAAPRIRVDDEEEEGDDDDDKGQGHYPPHGIQARGLSTRSTTRVRGVTAVRHVHRGACRCRCWQPGSRHHLYRYGLRGPSSAWWLHAGHLPRGRRRRVRHDAQRCLRHTLHPLTHCTPPMHMAHAALYCAVLRCTAACGTGVAQVLFAGVPRQLPEAAVERLGGRAVLRRVRPQGAQ